MKSDATTNAKDVDGYLAAISDADHRAILERVRSIIKATVPEATEIISYGMPAYRHRGILAYFGAWKNHWGLYPASSTINKAFEKELVPYKQTKGAIQFPWNQPLPADLLARLINYRLVEITEKAGQKPAKKPTTT